MQLLVSEDSECATTMSTCFASVVLPWQKYALDLEGWVLAEVWRMNEDCTSNKNPELESWAAPSYALVCIEKFLWIHLLADFANGICCQAQ